MNLNDLLHTSAALGAAVRKRRTSEIPESFQLKGEICVYVWGTIKILQIMYFALLFAPDRELGRLIFDRLQSGSGEIQHLTLNLLESKKMNEFRITACLQDATKILTDPTFLRTCPPYPPTQLSLAAQHPPRGPSPAHPHPPCPSPHPPHAQFWAKGRLLLVPARHCPPGPSWAPRRQPWA